MTTIEAVISDFGGVLTSPLRDSFTNFQDSSGIPIEALGNAMAAVAARELGLEAIWFRSTEQAIEEIEAALGA